MTSDGEIFSKSSTIAPSRAECEAHFGHSREHLDLADAGCDVQECEGNVFTFAGGRAIATRGRRRAHQPRLAESLGHASSRASQQQPQRSSAAFLFARQSDAGSTLVATRGDAVRGQRRRQLFARKLNHSIESVARAQPWAHPHSQVAAQHRHTQGPRRRRPQRRLRLHASPLHRLPAGGGEQGEFSIKKHDIRGSSFRTSCLSTQCFEVSRSHFQDACGAEENALSALKEPIDTIFVKSVRECGPAHQAGLRVGKWGSQRLRVEESM